MIRPGRLLAALGVSLLFAAAILAAVPVSVRASSVLPGPLRSALPDAFKNAEVGCGSVVQPKSVSTNGLIAEMRAVLSTKCTSSVRGRLRLVVVLCITGFVLLAVAVAVRSSRKSVRLSP
jgi:hypothetical protein